MESRTLSWITKWESTLKRIARIIEEWESDRNTVELINDWKLMRNSTTLANRQWQMQVEFLLSSVKDDVIDIMMLDISMGTDFGNKDQ